MCIVVKVNGFRYRSAPSEPEQFYHSCGTQGPNPRDVNVVHISRQFDAVAGCVESLEASGGLRIRGIEQRTSGVSVSRMARDSADARSNRAATSTRSPLRDGRGSSVEAIGR